MYDLIKRTAAILGDASAYPSDSPALHARYLRRLVRKHEQQQLRPSVATNTFMPVQNGNMDGLPTSALAALASAAQHPMHMSEASNIQPLLQLQLQTTISPTTLSIPGLEAMPTDWSFPEMPNDFDLDSFLNFPWHGDGTGGDVGTDAQWMF